MQRKFVRQHDNPREIKSFYVAFKQWKDKNNPIDLDWVEILAEDEAFSYNVVATEITVETSNNNGDSEEGGDVTGSPATNSAIAEYVTNINQELTYVYN